LVIALVGLAYRSISEVICPHKRGGIVDRDGAGIGLFRQEQRPVPHGRRAMGMESPNDCRKADDAALWLGPALLATLFAIWFRVSTALTEIIVGTLAQLILGGVFVASMLATNAPRITFLAGAFLPARSTGAANATITRPPRTAVLLLPKVPK
jgi:hypothetical protein